MAPACGGRPEADPPGSQTPSRLVRPRWRPLAGAGQRRILRDRKPAGADHGIAAPAAASDGGGAKPRPNENPARQRPEKILTFKPSPPPPRAPQQGEGPPHDIKSPPHHIHPTLPPPPAQRARHAARSSRFPHAPPAPKGHEGIPSTAPAAQSPNTLGFGRAGGRAGIPSSLSGWAGV